jgi:hypothetical protein
MPDPPAAQAPEARPAPVPVHRIGPSERITATLALSMIGFGVLILGVAFSQEDAAPVVPTLDVILTQTTTAEAPKNPISSPRPTTGAAATRTRPAARAIRSWRRCPSPTRASRRSR